MLSSRLLSRALAWRGLVTSRAVITGCWPGMASTKSNRNSSGVCASTAPLVGRPRAVSLSMSNLSGFTPAGYRFCFAPRSLLTAQHALGQPAQRAPQHQPGAPQVLLAGEPQHQHAAGPGHGPDQDGALAEYERHLLGRGVRSLLVGRQQFAQRLAGGQGASD